MANPLQQAAVRRKVIYLGAILGLFTVSLFWRGKFPVPVGNPQRPDDVAAGKAPPTAGMARVADWLARAPIGEQAGRLELRELDQGDPEIAGTVARLSLVGSRGIVITALWRAAIEKQKRNEWHEFELLARTVTRLQPNFITPWLFQAWNIAYNVSVENDKLGDMYYYIAHGIQLLTEGDRLNTKDYRGPDGVVRRIGSPDIRYKIGFYTQNKFAVSDKVNTLRSLMQLSVIPPSDRDPNRLRRNGQVDRDEFVKFCQAHPRLVRRLRAQLKLERPEDVVQFLDDNSKIPTRYKPTGELADADSADQFPIFPPVFPEGPDEFNPKSTNTDDTFDPFHMARGWFGYAMATTPPPKKDPFTGQPMPWATPTATEYDPLKYRMPRDPAYILFRQSYPRSQTYLAERLAQEGWFDDKSGWNPDERANASNLWLKKSESDPDVVLTTKASSRESWAEAYRFWKKYGEENALILDPATLQNYREVATRVPGGPGQLPQPGDFPPERMAQFGLKQYDIDCKKALIYYDQNRQMTNFPYFLAASEAEQDPLTVEARRILFRAEEERDNAENTAAIRNYVRGLAIWRKVLAAFPEFHRRAVGSDRTEEETYEYELDLANLLREDGAVRRRAERAAEDAVRALVGPGLVGTQALAPVRANVLADAAEDEALTRITLLDPRVVEAGRKHAEAAAFAAHHAALALAGAAAADAPGMVDGLKSGLAVAVVDRDLDWLKRYKTRPVKDANGNYAPVDDDYWVRPSSREVVRGRLGLTRESGAAPEGGEQEPAHQP